jgi:DDE superfamily endonuclease/Tetratricopeptide repeat
MLQISSIASRGHCLIDRELYVHASWFEDRQAGGDRCLKAHLPDELRFATKPELALAMAERTLSAGVGIGWIVGDEVYGRSRALRDWAVERGIGAVLAIPRNHRVELRAGDKKVRVDQVEVPPSAWGRYSAGSGSKGRRYFRWALAATQAAAIKVEVGDRHGEGMALNNLGNALGEVRRFEEAITAYTQAAAIFVEVGDRHSEGTALNSLGVTLRQMSRSGRPWRLWRAVLGRVGVYRKRSSAIDPHSTPSPAPV